MCQHWFRFKPYLVKDRYYSADHVTLTLVFHLFSEHEKIYGKIEPNSIVMMNSGWDKRFPDPQRIFGTSNVSDPNTFHFPGYDLEACKMLFTERQVRRYWFSFPLLSSVLRSLLDKVTICNMDVPRSKFSFSACLFIDFWSILEG